MSRPFILSRADIRSATDRSAGTLTLRYTGRHLRGTGRLFGFSENVFFAVSLNEVPLPDGVTTLASAVNVDMNTFPLTNELRRAVAELLAAEALLEAPALLEEIASPRTQWNPLDVRALEHAVLVAENKLAEVRGAVEGALRRRIVTRFDLPPVRPLYSVMPPPDFWRERKREPAVEAAPLPEPEPESNDVEDTTQDASEATGARVVAAIKVAREQELQQRLPGGARRALAHLPSGLYLARGSSLEMKPTICSALVAGAEGGRRSGESTVIDWDGEWPVVARRYGANGRIIYRVEQALRRSGLDG